MNRITICHTPLHLLLAVIETVASGAKNEVVLIAEGVFSEDYVSWANALAGVSVHRLAGSENVKGWLGKTSIRLENRRRIKALLDLYQNFDLMIFHDSKVETQYAIQLARARGSKVILGEDGMAIYPPGGTLNFDLLPRLLNQVAHGLWWKPRKRIGMHPSIDEVVCAFPSLVSDYLAGKKRTPLAAINPAMRRDLGLQARLSIPEGRYVLALLPLFEAESVHSIARSVGELSGSVGSILLKPHPRQGREPFELLKNAIPKRHIMIADQGWAAEVYGLAVPEPALVVGWSTSSLHLMRALFPAMEIVFLHDDRISPMRPPLAEFYRAVGIRCGS